MLGNIFHFHPKNSNANKEPHRQTKFKDVICSINLKSKSNQNNLLSLSHIPYLEQKNDAKDRQNPYSDEESNPSLKNPKIIALLAKENRSFHQDENDNNSNNLIDQRVSILKFNEKSLF